MPDGQHRRVGAPLRLLERGIEAGEHLMADDRHRGGGAPTTCRTRRRARAARTRLRAWRPVGEPHITDQRLSQPDPGAGPVDRPDQRLAEQPRRVLRWPGGQVTPPARPPRTAAPCQSRGRTRSRRRSAPRPGPPGRRRPPGAGRSSGLPSSPCRRSGVPAGSGSQWRRRWRRPSLSTRSSSAISSELVRAACLGTEEIGADDRRPKIAR